MSGTIDTIREEITELHKLIYAARDRGIPEDDPEVLGYVRRLHAREELIEELEELDRLRRGA
jgi:hypothetical protein